MMIYMLQEILGDSYIGLNFKNKIKLTKKLKNILLNKYLCTNIQIKLTRKL